VAGQSDKRLNFKLAMLTPNAETVEAQLALPHTALVLAAWCSDGALRGSSHTCCHKRQTNIAQEQLPDPPAAEVLDAGTLAAAAALCRRAAAGRTLPNRHFLLQANIHVQKVMHILHVQQVARLGACLPTAGNVQAHGASNLLVHTCRKRSSTRRMSRDTSPHLPGAIAAGGLLRRAGAGRAGRGDVRYKLMQMELLAIELIDGHTFLSIRTKSRAFAASCIESQANTPEGGLQAPEGAVEGCVHRLALAVNRALQ